MSTRSARWRRSLGLVAAVLAAALAVLLPAVPAFAHATLVESDPVDGSVLDQAPDRVRLVFNEPVRLTSQPVRVYDAEGQPVESTSKASGSEVTVDLADADLPDGTYVVGWYVVSADGHPVSGSLRFSVGEPSAEVAAPPPPPESSRLVEAVQGVLHGATYLGLLLAAGLAVFVAHVLPGRWDGGRARSRLRTVTRVAAGVAAVGAILLVPVASAYTQGLEVADLVSGFDASLVTNEVAFAALVVLGLGAVVAALPADPLGPRQRRVLTCGAAVAVLAPPVVGHTRAYQPEVLLVAGDLVHVSAGAVWLGGLAGLVLTLRALAGREELAARTLTRFSAIAATLLAAVALTGTLLAWRILSSWAGFLDTTYGRLLLAKIGIVMVVAALAGWNRFRLLPRVRASAGFTDRTRAAGLVRRTVLAEATMLVALLGVTGFLVSSSPRPAPVEVPPGRTGVVDGALGELRVLAVMSPREPGPNTLLIQLQDETGEPVELARPPTVELRTAGLDLGRVPVESVDAGTYRVQVLLPEPGSWDAQVSVRRSRFENPVSTVSFEVR